MSDLTRRQLLTAGAAAAVVPFANPFGFDLYEGMVPDWLYAHVEVLSVVLLLLALALVFRWSSRLLKGANHETSP